MTLFDSHTHLETFARASTLDATLARAREAGVTDMVTIGTGLDDWDLYRELAGTYAGVRYSVGLHPCAVDQNWEPALARVASYWESETQPRPAALGEIGLDRFHLPKEPKAASILMEAQKAAFAAGLAIAKTLDCPVVIHSRGAFRECVDMIDASGVDWGKVVFHCFVEGDVEMRELMSRGSWASFTGILTYKSAENVRAAARLQGLNRFLIETDAPYLTPVPQRGKPNEPAYLRHTAEFAAEMFGASLETLAEITTTNARAFFRL
jgi:TatD DNase family protein